MKRNITINLNGRLYHIDEDAYALLSQYTGSLRTYFQSLEGGEEIATDIECRISELFDDIAAAGAQAITIENIQDIIKRIGDISELSDGELSEENTGTPTPPPLPESNDIFTQIQNHIDRWFDQLKDRKFYLDKSNAKVAGVLSGCANYFGGTPFAWRMCFVAVLIFLVSLEFWPMIWLIIAYIIVAILAPEATTPDQRLKMKGIKVTPQNLANEMSGDQATPPPYSPSIHERASSIGVHATSLLSKLFHGIVFLLGAGCLLFMSVIFCMLMALLFSKHYMIQTIYPDWQIPIILQHIHTLWALGISTLLTALIFGYGLCRYGVSAFSSVSPMRPKQALLWLVALLISISGIVASGVELTGAIDEGRKEHYEKWRKEQEEREAARILHRNAAKADTSLMSTDTTIVIEEIVLGDSITAE